MKTDMDALPTIPTTWDREITRFLQRAVEDSGDVRRLLERLAATLELAAPRVPIPEEGNRFLVWPEERPE